MPEYVVALVEGGLRKEGMGLKESNVLIMGLTYRGDVKDTLNSPAISIAVRLGSLCHQVYAYDPLLGDEVGQFGPKVLGDLGEVGKAAQIDAVVVASDNSMFVEMNWVEFGQRLRRKVVVDGRQCLDLDKLRNQGWTAFSVGRVR
jgi:UDP-N-acetyl-D-mannosaminuronate dehydrogenase